MQVNTNKGQWVRAYGGSVNHLISGHSKTDSVTYLSDIHFACGKKAVWSQWGYDPSKKKCAKCEAAEQKMHPTKNGRGKSDKVSTPAVFGG